MLPTSLKSRLKLYFPFEKIEGEQVHDRSGNGFSGSIHGAVSHNEGRVGGAIEFDHPKDRVDVLDEQLLPTAKSADRTFMCWVKLDKRTEPHARILGKGGGRPKGFVWLYGNQDGARKQVVRINRKNMLSDSELPVGTWQHIAIALTDTKIDFYLNGIKDGSREIQGPIVPGSSSVFSLFDASSREKEKQGRGLMDELMIFNKRLSASEVQQVYRWVGGRSLTR
ncbi:MAG: LamG domain-containing protein, partial [Verrucomicrobiota bacterium]